METPARATTIAARSKNEPRRSAESTPTARPKVNQMIDAPTARDNVTGNRSMIIGSTGSLLRKE